MFFFHSTSALVWERIADVGALLVIVGVVGEGLEIAIKVAEHAQPKYPRLKAWIEKPKIRNKVNFSKWLQWCKIHELRIEVFGFIFWALVVLGLVVELK